MKNIIIVAMLFSGAASASVFKCIKQGATIYSTYPCGDDAKDISEKVARPNLTQGTRPPSLPASGSMVLTAGNMGTYSVAGSVNGIPVTYQVDTGATLISVSKRFIDQAKIYSCDHYIDTQTANGEIHVCVAVVPEVTFGIFRLNNVEVAIVPNMNQDALLGMDALRHFKIRQQGGLMTISN